jgi:DNA modification methylase
VNQLYYGDNLQVLREHLADASVDLIHLDPPFNSKRDYKPLFKAPSDHDSEAPELMTLKFQHKLRPVRTLL